MVFMARTASSSVLLLHLHLTFAISTLQSANAFFSSSLPFQRKRHARSRKRNVRPKWIGHSRKRSRATLLYIKTFRLHDDRLNENFGSTGSSSCAFIADAFDPESAASAINSVLYPQSELDYRLSAGSLGMGLSNGEAVASDDPRLSLTYAEFPLHSFGCLVDRARQIFSDNNYVEPDESKQDKFPVLVDLGSGAGRLLLYGALLLGGRTDRRSSFIMDFHGIEILPQLHAVAVEMLNRGVKEGWFTKSPPMDGNHADVEDENDGHNERFGKVCLHCGPAQEYATSVLHDADIIFAYSTAFPAKDFCVKYAAPMLGPEWSRMLAEACRHGCVAITTDRVLNPDDGWVLVDQLEVDNPELYGSVGYIQVLEV